MPNVPVWSAASLLAAQPDYTPSLSLFGGSAPTTAWLYVDRRFELLFRAMQYSDAQITDYDTKLDGLRECLNAKYWPSLLPHEITFIITGSWMKNTPVRTCSDIDVIFLLPHSVYNRYALRTGNIQSDLLQEIRQALLLKYPTTAIKGDGPTVVVDFSSVKVEIAPAFLDPTGSRYITNPNFKTWVCHTKPTGHYAITAPMAEAQQVAYINVTSKGDFVALMKMLKLWKKNCNVPIKTIALQMMAEQFLGIWRHRDAPHFWPDWLIRDFFAFILTQKNKSGKFPVTGEILPFKDTWVSHAVTAAEIARKACVYEEKSLNKLAGDEWQKIFGTMIPKEVL